MKKILDGKSIRENVALAVGFSSRCWDQDNVFDTTQALRIADELTDYIEKLVDLAARNGQDAQWPHSKNELIAKLTSKG